MSVELDRTECLGLLRSTPVGRVVLSIQCIPVAIAVGITVLGDELFIASDRGSQLTSDVHGQVVSIQADEFDPTTRTAWSVLGTGTAKLESSPEETVRASSGFRWLPGPDPMFIRLRPTLLTGRRFEWNGNLLGGGEPGV